METLINLTLGQIVALMGIPTAITGFCFWLVQRSITKRDKERERKEAEVRAKAEREEAARRKEAEDRETARENLMIATIQGMNAAIALGEATAKAVQRIPDAHCNGDMKAALEYATKVKHEQKELLTRQGVHAILE